MIKPVATAIFALVGLATLPAHAQSLCGPSGLTLTTTGGRLGDPFTISLTGTPSVSGLLGLDLAPGPVATPIGPLCLGLSPALQTVPFTLSPSGSFGLSVLIPPNPALAGLGVYAQAAAADPTQPGGVALSNGVHPVLRAPRIFFISTGYSGVAGSGAAFDALTDTFGPVVSLPSWVEAAVAVPALGWVAMILGNGSLMAFDAATGAITLNQPFTTNVGATHRMAAAGTTLVVTEETSFTSWATVQLFSLPNGAPSAVTPLPTLGAVEGIIALPGSASAYLDVTVPGGYNGNSSTIVPVLLTTGAPQTPISLSSSFDLVYTWLERNGIIYFMTGPPWGGTMGLNAIDTSINAPFFPNPVPLPFGGPIFACGLSPILFSFGSGTLGPTLFVTDPLASAILQLSPQTLSSFGPSIPLPAGMRDMKLSNGGSEWLIYSCQNCCVGGCTGGSCLPAQSLLSLSTTTQGLSTVGPLPSGNWGALFVLPSATLNKAYFMTNGVLAPFTTDPAMTPGPAIPVPPALQAANILVID